MATLEERIAALELKLGTLTPRRFPQGVDQVAVLNLLDKVLVGVNADGSAKVAAVNQIANLISATVGSGIEPTVEPNTTLPAPAQAGKIMIMKGGSYTQPGGGNLSAPANSFNVGYWDGTVWSIDISIETEADLTNYATKNDLGFSTINIDTGKDNMLIGGRIVQGYVRSDGQVDTGSGSTDGWLRTVEISVKQGSTYIYDCRGFEAGSKNLVYFDAARQLVGSNQINSVPHTFTPLAGAAYFIMNIKTPTNQSPEDIVLFENASTREFTSQAAGKDIAASALIENQSNIISVRRFFDRGLSVRKYNVSTKNILNELEFVEGYVRSNGIIDTGVGPTTGWVRTGMVAISPETQYTFSAAAGFTPPSSKNLCFYTENGTFISSLVISSNPFTFTAPVEAAYLVANLIIPSEGRTVADLINLQIEAGAAPTGHEPYPADTIVGIYGKHVGMNIRNGSNSAWVNLYPNVYAKLSNFINKYTTMSGNAENRCRIVMLGDSLFARHQHTSLGDVVPSKNPPTLITKNIGANIWQHITANKPLYRRFDDGGFTETGTWASSDTLPLWDDTNYISNLTRRSTSTNAQFSFSIEASTIYFNLIDRLDTAGSQTVTLSVPQNGILQVRLEGQSTWSEANGFVFSQRNPAPNPSAGIGNTKYQRRVEFRKVGAGIGDNITVTVTKGTADSSALMYWGLEMVNGDKPYVQLINVARGGHTIDMLKNFFYSDVIERKPDLILFEIPLLNMIGTNPSLTYIVNGVHDFVWGDRPGALNPNSLKNLSNDWQDFNVMLIVPHHSRTQFDSYSNFITYPSGYTGQELYNAVKGLIYSKNDVPFIDISSAMLYEAAADSLWGSDYYAAFGSSGIYGNGYFNDSVHQNDKGTVVWSKHLCPIFKISSL